MLTALTPGQRDRIRRLLEAELRVACRSAIASGARPSDVADLLAGRGYALQILMADWSKDLPADLVDDPQHPFDDRGSGRGIIERG